MRADTLTLKTLFQKDVRYVIPIAPWLKSSRESGPQLRQLSRDRGLRLIEGAV